MKPSMKIGVYNTYIFLAREGDVACIKLATCECAAGYVFHNNLVGYQFYYYYFIFLP